MKDMRIKGKETDFDANVHDAWSIADWMFRRKRQ